MTDRLAELQRGQSFASSADNHNDIEAGLDPEANQVLSAFNREADAIDNVYDWARKALTKISNTLDTDNSPAATKSVGDQLDTVENKLNAVRKRLKRIAGENKTIAQSGTSATSSLRMRIARYTKLGKDFMNITSDIETLRGRHKSLLAADVKRDILATNPDVTERQVDRAIESGAPLETVMDVDNSAMRHQIEDLRARNQDIQKLSKSIVELHQMFTDMSILVEGQQELINDIEYNVKQVKQSAKKGAEELVEARRHQKSARKKKMCITILVIIIIVGVAAAIIIPLGIKNNWWQSNNNSSTSSTGRTATVLDSQAFIKPPIEADDINLRLIRRKFQSRWYD